MQQTQTDLSKGVSNFHNPWQRNDQRQADMTGSQLLVGLISATMVGIGFLTLALPAPGFSGLISVGVLSLGASGLCFTFYDRDSDVSCKNTILKTIGVFTFFVGAFAISAYFLHVNDLFYGFALPVTGSFTAASLLIDMRRHQAFVDRRYRDDT